MAKKYYWLKLKDDFFTQPKIKKLRKLAGGDTLTIIYLKLQLLSLKNDGELFFEGLEETFAEELSLIIDEDKDNILMTLQYLMHYGLIEEGSKDEFVLTETKGLIGSETTGAERTRKSRENKKALQCNTPVTLCNTSVTKCNTEIEIDIEKDKEIDIHTEIERETHTTQDTLQLQQEFIRQVYDKWKENDLPLTNTSRNNYMMFQQLEVRPVLNDLLSLYPCKYAVLEAIDNAGQLKQCIDNGESWYKSPDNFKTFIKRIDEYMTGTFQIEKYLKKAQEFTPRMNEDEILF